MKQDEIIEMAVQAGVDEWWDSGNEQREVLQEHLEAFAKLAADKEREACAKVCDEYSATGKIEEFDRGWLACAKNVAAAIRARGNA